MSSHFFRKGKTDSWKSELTEKHINNLMETHELVIKKLGY